jgi:hypothetical protein
LYNRGGVEGGLFSPGGGVEIEPDAHLLAIDTKMAFTVTSLLLGMVKITDMTPDVLI